MRRPRWTATGLVLLAMVALASCDVTGPDPLDDLREARDRWIAAGITDYVYTLRRGCFCTPDAIGPVEITVVGGQITDRVFQGEFGELSSDVERLWPDINGLFEFAEREIRESDEVTIRYDPELGLPLEISVDRIREAVDDEESLTVTSFRRTGSF